MTHPYGYDKNLCVWPSKYDESKDIVYEGTESQFEAFQSIISNILDDTKDSPYMYLLEKYGLFHTYNKRNLKEGIGIYIDKIKGDMAHYVAVINKILKDPYKLYQAKDTQGFCQMFAFFIATDDVDGFIPVNQRNKINVDEFNKLAINTQECAEKLLNLLDSDMQFYNLFNKSFTKMVKSKKTAKILWNKTTNNI